MLRKSTSTSYAKTSAGKAAKRFAIVQRRRTVMLLLNAGHTQVEVAEQLGVSEATISDDVAAITQGLRHEAALSLQQKVDREEAALLTDEAMFRVLLAEAGSLTGTQRVYDTVLAIMRRRSELLGFDATERRKLLELEGSTEGLDELLARVLVEVGQE